MSISAERWKEPCFGIDTREEAIKKGCFVPKINTAPWEELNEWLSNYRKRWPEREIWKIMERFPIDPDAIDKLIKEEWELRDYVEFQCSLERKIISLERGVRGYSRDRGLFHEIVHAVYGEKSSDAAGHSFDFENRAIVEWMARKCRSEVVLLRHTITRFHLKPYVYDSVSRLAFGMDPVDIKNQLAFPFGERRKEALSRVCMDREYTYLSA